MSDLDELEAMNTSLATDKSDGHPNRVRAGVRQFNRIAVSRKGHIQWNTRRKRPVTLAGQEKPKNG